MYLYVKLNRDAYFFIPVKSEDYMNSRGIPLRMSGVSCRLQEGHSLF